MAAAIQDDPLLVAIDFAQSVSKTPEISQRSLLSGPISSVKAATVNILGGSVPEHSFKQLPLPFAEAVSPNIRLSHFPFHWRGQCLAVFVSVGCLSINGGNVPLQSRRPIPLITVMEAMPPTTHDRDETYSVTKKSQGTPRAEKGQDRCPQQCDVAPVFLGEAARCADDSPSHGSRHCSGWNVCLRHPC